VINAWQLRGVGQGFARLLLAVTVSSLGAAASAEPISSPAQIYHRYCSVCHGDNGDGISRARGGMNPPPRDFVSSHASTELTRERMIKSVSEGRPGTAMAAWKNQLSPGEIASVVDHIQTRFMMPVVAASDVPGKRTYAEFCSVCHGDRGDGDSRAKRGLNPPPRNFTTTRAATELDRERMTFSVTYGRANTAMAPWGEQLTKAQVEAVVDYIRQAFMQPDDKASGESAHAMGAPDSHANDRQHTVGETDMAAPMPHGLVADIDSGKSFYRQNCTGCHGERGDGKGPRAYFINPKPRDFSHPASRSSLNRPHLFESISHGKTGTEMPAWRHVLGPQEIANVTEYVYLAFIGGDAPKEGSTAHAP